MANDIYQKMIFAQEGQFISLGLKMHTFLVVRTGSVNKNFQRKAFLRLVSYELLNVKSPR